MKSLEDGLCQRDGTYTTGRIGADLPFEHNVIPYELELRLRRLCRLSALCVSRLMFRLKRRLDYLVDRFFLKTKSAVMFNTLYNHPLTQSLLAALASSSSDILGFCQPA